jgi:hypothetical protein
MAAEKSISTASRFSFTAMRPFLVEDGMTETPLEGHRRHAFCAADACRRKRPDQHRSRQSDKKGITLIQGSQFVGNLRYLDINYTVAGKRITATKIIFCYEYSYDNFASVLVVRQ